jgi:hypothetical protein
MPRHQIFIMATRVREAYLIRMLSLDCAHRRGRAIFVVAICCCWFLLFAMGLAWFLFENFLKVDLIRTTKQNNVSTGQRCLSSCLDILADLVLF